MKKNTYFEADLHRLNKKASEHHYRPGPGLPEAIMGRLLPNNNQSRQSAGDRALNQSLSELINNINKQVNWKESLPEASFVVFDTETTGLRPFRGDEIISLGAVIVQNGKILNRPMFHRLVNPGRPVSAKAKEITGIKNEMLKEKPPIIPVIKDFLEFCGPRILVAHNASFDLAFLNLKVGEATGGRIVNPVIDTVLLASALYYHLEDYSLENLSSRFGYSLTGRHSAIGDARITATLFLKLLPELKARGITHLPHLSRFLSGLDPGRSYPLIF